jgi:hypothetical protein
LLQLPGMKSNKSRKKNECREKGNHSNHVT